MSFSNYPNGFNKVTVRGLPLTMQYPGEVFWVDGSSITPPAGVVGGNDGNIGSFQKPFATIDFAIGKCIASRGDIIIVKPGHTETVIADGGITADVADVAIIGLGSGTSRPTVTFTTAAAAAVAVSAANVTMMNIVFTAGFADVTNAIDVTAAEFNLLNCEFNESGANLNYVDVIAATGAANTADGLHIEGCVSSAIDAAINSFLSITDDLDRLVCNHNLVVHDHANALAMILCATGKDLTNCQVNWNEYHSLKATGDILIDNDTTANSGTVAYNVASHADTVGEVLIDCDGVGMFENYATGVITASGYILPARDS